MADSKISALTEISVPALEDLLETVDDPSGTPVSNKVSANRFLAQLGILPGGRLTLTSGTAVTTSDVSGAGTLYYTTYQHNRIRVYDGTRWIYKVFAESSLALTLTSGKNYDVFLDDDVTTLSLSAGWTNDTTRADALGVQDGVTVLSSDHTKLWLGTIRASGSNTSEDSETKRFVWNAYNAVRRSLFKTDTTATWTYSTYTWRQARGDAANQVEILAGLPTSALTLTATGNVVSTTAAYSSVSIGEDSTTTPHAHATVPYISLQAAGVGACAPSTLNIIPSLGYHKYCWLETGNGSGTQTWQGQQTDTQLWSRPGLVGTFSA